MSPVQQKKLFDAARRFSASANVIDVRPLGNGNINDTFLVTLNARTPEHFVLQRLNTAVFHRPEMVMKNMRLSTGHMRNRLRHIDTGEGRRWEVPSVLLSAYGNDYWIDPDSSFWRAVGYIENAASFDVITDVHHAGEAGYALGLFHALLSDLPADSLAETLEGFHVAPLYLKHYDEIASAHSGRKSPEMNYCTRFIREHRSIVRVLEDAAERGELMRRPVHGDPKINNILMDDATGKAVSIIDLDTVRPGLVHYDIGDCLRSGCNLLGEETDEWEAVIFDTELCRAVLRGYGETAAMFLTDNDYKYIYDSIRLLAFELGLRFFTDHLQGDVYFKTRFRGHNLRRALVQFRLAASIESREKEIRQIIRELR